MVIGVDYVGLLWTTMSLLRKREVPCRFVVIPWTSETLFPFTFLGISLFWIMTCSIPPNECQMKMYLLIYHRLGVVCPELIRVNLY